MPPPSTNSEAPIADIDALERFVADNEDLLALEERIGRFNIFDALGIVRTEIRHSNFLAWLLNPSESHGQGDLFLKAVVMDVFRESRKQGFVPPISLVELDGADLMSCNIRREWHHIDLLIVDDERRFVVVIENKVDSGEHSDQLNRYEQVIASAFPQYKRLCVFLTPAGERASDNDWATYSYQRLHQVLVRVQRSSAGAIGGDVGVFVAHYMNLLETRLMEDKAIAELCKKVYANHRRAIDLVFEHASVGGSASLGPVAEAVEALEGKPWIFPNRTGRWFRCIPEAWTHIMPPYAQQVPNPHALLFYEVWVDANKCTVVTLTMAPCSDRPLRMRLFEHLKSEAVALGLKPNIKATVDSEWTRLFSTHPYRWTESHDPEELASKTLKATKELLGKVHAVTDSLQRFFAKETKGK